MKWKLLDKADTLVFKGIAIMMIAIHNFMGVFPLPRHNEFVFKREYFDNFLYLMRNEPENGIRWIFAYLGHFGLQIFIFLSAYGLCKKYHNTSINYREFLVERTRKIYPAFLMALLAWLLLRVCWNALNDSLSTADFMIDAVILKLTLLSNFFPEYALKPVGPWWFLPMVFQFYVIFPLLLKCLENWGEKSLVLISLVSLLIVVISQESFSFNYYYTVLPYIPGFCLGIYMAKIDSNEVRISIALLLLLVCVFILGNIYQPFWYLTHFCALIILLALFQLMIRVFVNVTVFTRFFQFIGILSMQIFFLHGFLRTPLADWAKVSDNYQVVYLLCTGYLIMTIYASYCAFHVEDRLRQVFSKRIL